MHIDCPRYVDRMNHTCLIKLLDYLWYTVENNNSCTICSTVVVAYLTNYCLRKKVLWVYMHMKENRVLEHICIIMSFYGIVHTCMHLFCAYICRILAVKTCMMLEWHSMVYHVSWPRIWQETWPTISWRW